MAETGVTAPAEIVIRLAAREDAACLHALLERLAETIGKPGGIRGAAADIARFGFGETPAFTALIAWRGADAVGFVLFFPDYSSWRGRPGGYVQDLYVAPGCRGAGLADALLAEVARRAAARGGCYLRLSVDAANQAAQRYYARAGFRHAAEECMFVADGEAFKALAGRGGDDANGITAADRVSRVAGAGGGDG